MRISACVITKNEEKNIGRWLECVQGFADEIIVVDTGSTDSTVDIARAAGARVEHFAWIDDFAAAKNYAIELATGDWIAFLDADEYFTAASVPRVRQVLTVVDGDKRIAGVHTRLVNIDSNGCDMGTGLYKTRLFRRRPWLRYVGSVHEHLQNLNPAVPQEMRRVDELVIYHTGYSPEIMQAKAERNLAILLARREREGEQPLDAFHLADCYYGLQRYSEAARYARLAIADKHQATGMEKRPYQVLTQSLILGGAKLAEIEAAVAEAIARFPEAAELYIIGGEGRWQRGAHAASAELFARGIEVEREIPQETAAGRNLVPLAYQRLGELALETGDRAAAFDTLLAGVRLQPRSSVLLRLLLQAVHGLAAGDIVELLNSIYSPEQDAAYLAQVLADCCEPAALYYNGRAQVLDTATCYLLAGRVEEAARLAIEERERLECTRAALTGEDLTVGEGYQRRRIARRAKRLASYLAHNN